jgi:endonuclease/exonuclease/phosphatase family metal-dependent hydrolase
MPLKLIDLNIEGNRHLAKIIPFLQQEKPDVVCLQEVFRRDLANFSGWRRLFQATVNLPRPLKDLPGRGLMGPAILTRLPIKASGKCFYPQKPPPIPVLTRPGQDNRVLLWLTLTKAGQDYTVATTHFTWTPDGRPDQRQRRDLTSLLAILKTFPEFILAGDFNAPRQSPIYQTLARTYRDWMPKTAATTIDPQLHYANKKQPGRLALVVDHLFTTNHYRAKVQVRCGLSDHCALIAVIDKL